MIIIRRLGLSFFVGGIVLFLAGCQGLYFLPSEIKDPYVLFQDDFSRLSGGWEVDDTISFIRGYDRGGYRILIKEANLSTWSILQLPFQDTWITVKATKLGGPDKNGFGIVCRYSNEANFYFALVASDGYYGIGKQKDGIQTLIGAKNLDYSQIIQQGEFQLLGCGIDMPHSLPPVYSEDFKL